LYSSTYDLPELRKHKNFNELSGFVVDGLKRFDGYWSLEGLNTPDNKRRAITASRIVMAAGTLATTRIVLGALHFKQSVPVLSCPIAAFMLWLPNMLGIQRLSRFGLGQLSFLLALRENISAFGSTFSTTGIPLSEFVAHVPIKKRYAIDLMRSLLSSCVVGNLFLPGHLTAAKARLKEDGVLMVTGKYDQEVMQLMIEAKKKLRKAYWSLGALLLPGSFTVGRPGGDIHYAGTLPMRKSPKVGETTPLGEVMGLDGVYVVDGACLPVLPGKSHTLTMMANADRIGGQLAITAKSNRGTYGL
jgi:hypothetical protein